MKLKMNTSILPLICPGLYGTILGDTYNDLDEVYNKNFKNCICEYGKEKIEEILNEDLIKEYIGDFKIDNVIFGSPKWYNYENDWLEFDMEVQIDNSVYYKILDAIENRFGNVFWDFIKENYSSHDGFISLMPYTKEKYLLALNGEDLERSIAMFIMFLVTYSDIDLDWYQRDFEDDIQEEVNKNGWINYEEED